MPKFAEVYPSIVLRAIAAHGRIGRKHLAKELKIGEGSIRTILNRLEKEGLISSSRGGHVITLAGKKVLEKEVFVRVKAKGLTVGKANVATLVRGGAKKVKLGLEERDEAIKVGARGATVLVFRKGKLMVPGNVCEIDPEAATEIISALHPADGDLIIIGTGDDFYSAEAGARAAALLRSTNTR
ncbi:MAG: DUF4443 domain-containing protein [Candidatus Hadarchaeales archaeon]